MTVYVDDMRAPFGMMVMSHLIADTDDELHAMAQAIGVARRWHQAPPRHDSHYDIAQSMRRKAIALGAVEITWREAAAMNARRRAIGQLGQPGDAVAWLIEHLAERRAAAAARRLGAVSVSTSASPTSDTPALIGRTAADPDPAPSRAPSSSAKA